MFLDVLGLGAYTPRGFAMNLYTASSGSFSYNSTLAFFLLYIKSSHLAFNMWMA